jgi:hypothetical protein
MIICLFVIKSFLLGTMKKYRKLWKNVSSRSGGGDSVPKPTAQPVSQPTLSPLAPINMKLDDLPWDPSDRPIIYIYDPNIVEEIRWMYWDRGPCRPRGHKFSKKYSGLTNYMNDAWICNIEKELFAKVTNEDVMKSFKAQNIEKVNTKRHGTLLISFSFLQII